MTITIYKHIAINPTDQFGVKEMYTVSPKHPDGWTDGGSQDYQLPEGFRAIANYGGDNDLFVNDNDARYQTYAIVNRNGKPALWNGHRAVAL
jgi:hypothetical protein